MTTVKIGLNHYKVKISISGHAKAATFGESDLVCAAMSALSTTLVQCLLDTEYKGYIEDFKYDMAEGDINISYSIIQEGITMVNAIMYTVFTGFDLLERQYPDNVKVQR